MHTSQVEYNGQLRTTATHIRSGNTLITDAPVDNHGRGEAFSPTDLLATSLASCMISIMAIAAEGHQFELRRVTADVVKTMSPNPRKVSKVQVDLYFPEGNYSKKQQEILKRAALSCPVSLSLHPDLEQEVNFKF